MTLVAAFKMLLYGYTGQEDLCVATHIANRNRRETEEVIGLFVNTVILRTDLRGDPTCQEVLQRVRATALAAYAHQDLPFEDLVQTLERERGLKPSSLCQVMFILQNAMHRPLQRSARTLSFLETDLSILMPPLVGTTFDVVLLATRKAARTHRVRHLQTGPVRCHDHRSDAGRLPACARMSHRRARATALNLPLPGG